MLTVLVLLCLELAGSVMRMDASSSLLSPLLTDTYQRTAICNEQWAGEQFWADSLDGEVRTRLTRSLAAMHPLSTSHR